ncbi:MAG: X2-like carbohydrate binding domain-containing protein [Leifsonia sp.]|uniref:X2-like carbohydrate binding domain-containing protein n=1 Tax=Leifsonia sp. TaxID=1870902 RepID=UPI003F80793E
MTRQTRARRGLAALLATIAAVGMAAAAAVPAGATPTPTATASPAASATPPTPAAAATTAAAPDAWAAKPYMGWSSYSMQVYSGNPKWITADQLLAQSDAMHAKLQKAGYDYINVDSGWTDHVDGNGRPAPSAELYPQGLQKVIDHVHANGQKFGLYLIPGISPAVYEKAYPIANAPGCTTHDIVKQPLQQADYWKIGYRIDFGNPCAQKYVDSVVDQLAAWGVNFLKFDSVTPGSGVSDLSLDARDDVAAWSKALKSKGIWFELSWALDIDYADTWKQYANGWRVEWDVECYCAGVALTQWDNIARLFPRAADWWRHAGPGGWNDFDSLDVGNGTMDGLTRDERRTATTLWAISAAPMYVGNDLTKLDAYGIDLLTNREVVAVNQAGTPAQPVSTATDKQVWYAPNADGSFTVALFNLGRTDADVTAKWSDIGLKGAASVRDLWAGTDLGTFASSFTGSTIPIHGVRLLKVTPQKGTTVSLNDDAQRVQYEGAWTRNDGREVAATTQPLQVAVGDSSAGAVPAPPASGRIVAVNDDDPGIAYSGSWGQSGSRGLGDYKDDVHYAEADGASFQYTFTGTGIDYVTELDTSQGDVDVYLDGVFQKTVSTGRDAGQPRQSQQVAWSATGLPDGSHTLRVVKKSGGFMLLDKLDVTLSSLLDPDTAVFDKAKPADVSVTLRRDGGELAGISRDGADLTEGTDYTVSGTTATIRSAYLAGLPDGTASLGFRFRGDAHDDVHATTADGATVSLSFRGTGVAWIGATAPDQGTAAVYVDGKLVRTVDTHSDARRTGRTLFSVDGLRDGDHRITVTKVSGDVLRTDLFRYTVKKK